MSNERFGCRAMLFWFELAAVRCFFYRGRRRGLARYAIIKLRAEQNPPRGLAF
jgi:hypothetical protein